MGRRTSTLQIAAALLFLPVLVDGGLGMGDDGLGFAMADAGKEEAFSQLELTEKLPSQGDVPPEFFCHSCQEVSRKVEKFLTDPSLSDEVATLSNEVCHILRSDLQVTCRQLVDLYLREGILFLQIAFKEKNICNYTGFCPADNSTSTSLFPSAGGPAYHPSSEVRERKRCDACHVATEEIRRGLEDHEQQIRVLKSLLEACQSLRTYADQCKRLVFQYGPLALANLQKFLGSKDLCLLIHMCEQPAPPHGGGERFYD